MPNALYASLQEGSHELKVRGPCGFVLRESDPCWEDVKQEPAKHRKGQAEAALNPDGVPICFGSLSWLQPN